MQPEAPDLIQLMKTFTALLSLLRCDDQGGCHSRLSAHGEWVAGLSQKRTSQVGSANLVSDCMLMLLLDCKEAKGEACLLLYLLTTASSNMSVPAFLLVLNSIIIMCDHARAYMLTPADGHCSFLELRHETV